MSRFTAFYKKGFLQLIQNFLWNCPFSNLLKKQTFQLFLSFFRRESIFGLKREVFSEFPRKCFKITGKHCLAVCGSFWGEKQFLLIFVPFYWFDQKQLFKQIQIFCNKLVKKNKLSEYLCASFRDSHFLDYKDKFTVN